MDKTLLLAMVVSLFTGFLTGEPAKKIPDIPVNGVTFKQLLNSIDLAYNDTKLKIVWTEVEDISKLKLIQNFQEKKTARSAYEDLNCKLLVNGGFYTKDSKPIGLFIAQGKQVSPYQTNKLFNGILGVNLDGRAQIATVKGEYREAVQSGPVLIKDGIRKELSIKNDEPERRMVAIITKEDKLIFAGLYSPSAYYVGPYLENLPGILKSFEKELGVEIKDAINLDGGTASALYTDEISLTEVRHLGSYFCAGR